METIDWLIVGFSVLFITALSFGTFMTKISDFDDNSNIVLLCLLVLFVVSVILAA
jgi:hypothetical protein